MRKSDYLASNGEEPDGEEPVEENAKGEEVATKAAVRSQQIEALRQHQMRSWWWFAFFLWLTIGLLSMWALRFEFQELNDYFTWAAVRAMLVFNRLPTLGLGACFGLTTALLYAESRHILFGLSKAEKQQLRDRLSKIESQGPSHPQWKIIATAPMGSKQ